MQWYKRSSFAFLLAISIGCVFLGCTGSGTSNKPYQPSYTKDTIIKESLILGFPSLAFYEKNIGFGQYLNRYLSGDIHVEMMATNTLDDYISKVLNGTFAIALVNAELAVKAAKQGYHIVGKFADDNQYRGVILARKESAVKQVQDLKGKIIACPGPEALAGTKQPLYYLATHGLNLQKDVSIVHVASFESVYMNVYLGKTFAGTAWISAWESFAKQEPTIAAKLVPLWITESLPSIALIIRNDVPVDVEEKLLELIFNMHLTKEGQKILLAMGTLSFKQANADSYKKITDFLDLYQKIAPITHQ